MGSEDKVREEKVDLFGHGYVVRKGSLLRKGGSKCRNERIINQY